MYTEDNLLLISALQHLAFCERQWGLMYLENIWAENLFTAEGKVLHLRPDEPETESRVDLRIARGLRLRSLRLGLTGIADVVEFHRLPDAVSNGGNRTQERTAVRLDDVSGLWKPQLVEYKRGKPKMDYCDEVQICAQALCLEEMLGVNMQSGELFYGKPRRRTEVVFSDALREQTETLAVRLHHLTAAGKTPPGRYEKRCRSCSLLQPCLPKVTSGKHSPKAYLLKAFDDVVKNTGISEDETTA